MEVPQEVGKAKNRTLQHDHAVLRETFAKVMDEEDVKAMFQSVKMRNIYILKM